MAEERIGEKADYGIVSYISNSSYLTGRSHPLMRESLMSNFHKIWIDNLNGDKYRTGKLIPKGLPGAGTADQSIFTTGLDPRGIQPGTAIVTWLKRKAAKTRAGDATVLYRDFWGLAAAKRAGLIASLPTGETKAPSGSATPNYKRLKPSRDNRWRLSPHSLEGGYETWPSLDELFSISFRGVEPNRGLDGTVIDIDRSRLAARVSGYLSAPNFVTAAQQYPGFARKYERYNAGQVWEQIKRIGFQESKIVQSLIFPYDARWIYYETHGKWLNESREEFGANLSDNEFLITVPEPRKVSETRPVFARETRSGGLFADPEANIDERAWRKLRDLFELSGERFGENARVLVGKLFRLAFAILYAPAYQAEHASALSADWAHLPIPKGRDLFDRLVEAGDWVSRLLDANRDARDVVETILGHDRAAAIGSIHRQDGSQVTSSDLTINVTYWGGGKGRWKPRPFTEEEKPDTQYAIEWGDRTGDLFINDTAFFANVPENVWTYQLAGYPVLKKWLGYRQADRRDGKPLTNDERRWFRSMIQRVAALLALGPRLNALYQEISANCFTSVELGMSPEVVGERRDAKKNKTGPTSITPAMKQTKKPVKLKKPKAKAKRSKR
jgi:type ISP restriction-modification system protein